MAEIFLNNNDNNNNNGLLTDPQIFSSYSYLRQPVLLTNISVYCWVQIKLLLVLLLMPGQSRVVLARQGKTLLKFDSSLRV